MALHNLINESYQLSFYWFWQSNPQPQGITVNGWDFINKTNIKAWNQRLLSHFLYYACILMGRL